MRLFFFFLEGFTGFRIFERKNPSLVQPMGSPIKQEAAFLCGSCLSLGESY